MYIKNLQNKREKTILNYLIMFSKSLKKQESVKHNPNNKFSTNKQIPRSNSEFQKKIGIIKIRNSKEPKL